MCTTNSKISADIIINTLNSHNKLLNACKLAVERFCSQNGHVSREVWNNNYNAYLALTEAIEAAKRNKEIV